MKTAIVFGATSGIGKSLTEILVKDGYKVAITGRRIEQLRRTKSCVPNSNFSQTKRYSASRRCREKSLMKL